MALFRNRMLPDGIVGVFERIYVFDSCFRMETWENEEYKGYLGRIITQFKETYSESSVMIFNFREGHTASKIHRFLSQYFITIMDYPLHYESCPLLSVEVIHHFLKSSESWLSLEQHNILLMHSELGGWPVMAFMSAALLLYRKHYTDANSALEMVQKQAPPDKLPLHLLSELDPTASQLRYLQYVSMRNADEQWPPPDKPLKLDCVIMRMIPDFNGKGGCCPVFRIYGRNPLLHVDKSPKLLFSTPRRSKNVRSYNQAENELVKIDINCNIQGDIVLECINLNDDLVKETIMYRAIFNTAFIKPNTLILNCDEVDISWDKKDQFPKDFKAELLFSEMDPEASKVPVDLSSFEEAGVPIEAFGKLQEMFSGGFPGDCEGRPPTSKPPEPLPPHKSVALPPPPPVNGNKEDGSTKAFLSFKSMSPPIILTCNTYPSVLDKLETHLYDGGTSSLASSVPASSPPPPLLPAPTPPPPKPSQAPPPPPPPPPPINRNKEGGPGPLPPPPASKGGGVAAPPPSPPINKPRALSGTTAVKTQPAKNLKPLRWLKVNRVGQGTMWVEAEKSGEAERASEIDMSELETLFSRSNPNSDNVSKAKTKPEKVQLIEDSRAYYCEIMLSKVKRPLPELMEHVLNLDELAMDVDQVDNFIKFCPTKEEMELLKGYKGEPEMLGKCEQFFLELMKVPRSEAKLVVFSYKIQFRTQVSELNDSLKLVYLSVEQLINSVKLRRVMQSVLSLGNALNQGTTRGAAAGFRLDSLLKLNETRARSNKMTLMHYLCKVIADKLPELLDFSKELSSLEPASKIQLKILVEEMTTIKIGLEKLVQEKKLCKKDGNVSKKFRKSLKKFLASAKPEVKYLYALYSKLGKSVDALTIYFGEDPAKCPYERIIDTLLKFVRMFNQAHDENCKQIEAEKKAAQKAAEQERLKAAEKGKLRAEEKEKLRAEAKENSKVQNHSKVESELIRNKTPIEYAQYFFCFSPYYKIKNWWKNRNGFRLQLPVHVLQPSLMKKLLMIC